MTTSVVAVGMLVLVGCTDRTSSGPPASSEPAAVTSISPPSLSAAITTASTTTAAPTTTLPVWPAEIVEPLTAACAGVAPASACACVVDEARRTMEASRFEEIASEMAAGGPLPADLLALVEPCRA